MNNDDYIGPHTRDNLVPFIRKLYECITNEKAKIKPQTINGLEIVEDCGLKEKPVNNFPGEYRCFNVKDRKGMKRNVGILIAGNDPNFDKSNRTGYTVLAVAVDSHAYSALQLQLDKYTDKQGNYYKIWHDGTMAQRKKNEVMEHTRNYTRSHGYNLEINYYKVILGKLDNTMLLTFEQKEMREFITNLIIYALARDEFKNT